jgi:drug/metabolite transporter (DMT)-like permease
MKSLSNATRSSGVTLGLLGVLGFSFSLPATKLAVEDLDPWFVAFGRAVVAALLAAAVLAAARAVRPTPAQVRSLVVVAVGVVVGFPLFTSLALEDRTSAHAAVVIALLPIATALAAVARAGERPSLRFWLAALAGAGTVVLFAVSAGAGDLRTSDLHLLAAVALCGLGYAEGGVLARDLGGARTICWALLVALPVTVPVTLVAAATGAGAAGGVGATAWLGFAYVSVVSMFLGFFAWYAGLARGGVARVGQVQLAQPVLTLGWAALLLGEPVGAGHAARRAARARQRRRDAARAGRLGPPAAAAEPPVVRAPRRRRRGEGRARPPCDGIRPLHERRRQDLPARHVRRGPREGARVRVCGRRDEPRPPRRRGRARGRARRRRRAADVRRRLRVAGRRAGDLRSRGRDRLRADGPRRAGVRLGAARRGRGRDHDHREVKDVRREDGRAFFVFETVSRNQRGETVCTATWTNIVREAEAAMAFQTGTSCPS